MKKNPFTYLKNAPALKDARLLRPTEKARKGDRYFFLANWEGYLPERFEQLNHVNSGGFIRLGVSLTVSRSEWEVDFDRDRAFDGVIYRPVKSKK
jgi:hypothetical protein